MPLYEYNCDACKADFEALVRSGEEPACPACGSGRLAKQLSVPAAHFAGARELPVCEAPSRGPCGMGGCGLPECG